MTNPMDFFMTNVDAWGAKEWFNRLREAVVEHDKAVVEAYTGEPSESVKDLALLRADTFKTIVVTTAFRLAREHDDEILSALARVPVGFQHRIWFEDTEKWSDWREGRLPGLYQNKFEERLVYA